MTLFLDGLDECDTIGLSTQYCRVCCRLVEDEDVDSRWPMDMHFPSRKRYFTIIDDARTPNRLPRRRSFELADQYDVSLLTRERSRRRESIRH